MTIQQKSDTPDIRSLGREDLSRWMKDLGCPDYRTGQVLQWLYSLRVTEWDQMTNIPLTLRRSLSESFTIHVPQLVRVQGSRDTTCKFLWRLADHSMVESVLIPANPALYGDSSDRKTLCVSTQVGCAYGCRFCASGLDGWKRNLSVDEIVGQIIAVENWHAEQTGTPGPVINNLVFMGMGEPLANYKNLLPALRILNASWGMNIGARKITISTSGLAPMIMKLADEPEQFRLAISLHGATDAVRDRIMPVNRKYPLQQLTDACLYFQKRKGKMITLEYILIEGINDTMDQVPHLARLAGKLKAKVNLIPYNTVDGLDWKRPSVEVQEKFAAGLREQGVTATLRREKGHDIDAACGQLRLRTEKETSSSAL
jgi:23S rRNA (adenine2503-C2)-methyltransferase